MLIKSLIAGAVLMLPLAAFAQDADTKYCSDLSAEHRRFTNNLDPEAARAMGQCQSNPAAAIPVLEKHLKENKIALPSRT